MLAVMTPQVSKVLDALERQGLLLKQDKVLPNVVTLLTGESLAGSWWSHARAREIFAVLARLADHPDVLFVKLLRRKDTLVHRALWPALVTAIGASSARLSRDLSAPARALLVRVERSSAPVAATGALLKELSARVLVYAQEVHTASGRHEMRLESWSAWRRRMGITPLGSDEEARRAIERACERLGASLKDLPWNASAST
jgi:hypothetical protein